VITVRRRLHVELHYHVLSLLDLGRDAASLFDCRRKPRSWSTALRDAYLAAPGRLLLQGLPLFTADLAGLLDALAGDRLFPAGGAADRRLCSRFAEALLAEAAEVERQWRADEPASARRAADFLAAAASVARVRTALWSQAGAPEPALEVLDCPSLRSEGGTHGRSTARAAGHVVAVALAAPLDQVLCQILHEEMHPVTDRALLAEFPPGARDTRVGADGFALHARIEKAAVDTGQRLIDAYAPELAAAYRHWRGRHGA